MNQLNIKLTQKYKSFEADFNTSLTGDLIILSGINGSGKSQLLNVIYGLDGKDFDKKIPSFIQLNGEQINYKDIDYRSFKDNITIPELTQASTVNIISHTNQAWSSYTSDRLNSLNYNNYLIEDSCFRAKEILIGKFGKEKFINGLIEEDEFKTTLKLEKFIWKVGDKFTNSIGEIFFNHAIKVGEKMKDVGRANFDNSMLEKAPWTLLNELFEKLNFEYRFKSDYFLNGFEINEQPSLFSLNSDRSINENEKRLISELSDGEKTIISLCFASLSGNEIKKKILLLDELDSVLNPSLIEKFFIVINDYFIKQGIMVIMSTHSSSTVSLSPDYTKYYEIFKPIYKNTRILEVSKDDYTELFIANKNFYDKISNQQNRINELEKSISSNQEILIVTEGKTDWKHIITALRYFHSKSLYKEISEDFFYRFGSKQDLNDKICDTNEVNELSESKLKNYLSALVDSRSIDNNYSQVRIGVFDSDTNTNLVNDSEKNVYSMKIKPDGISTEFLFKEDEIKTIINEKRLFIGNEFDSTTKRHRTDNFNIGGDNKNLNKAGKRAIIETDVYNERGVNMAISKEKFAQAVYNQTIKISDESWEDFAHIFDFIISVIQ